MQVTYLLVPINEGNKAILSQLNIIPKEIIKKDINETCRICLRQEEKINLCPLYDDTNGCFESMSISTAISECFGLKINEDVNVSSYICSKCVIKVQDAHTFKSIILKGEKVVTVPLRVLESTDNQVETVNTLFPTYREEKEEIILPNITTCNEIKTSAVSPVAPVFNNVLITPLKEESNSISTSSPESEINDKNQNSLLTSILGKLLTTPPTSKIRYLKMKKNKNINGTQTSSKLHPKTKRTYKRGKNKNDPVSSIPNNEIASSPLMSEHSYSKSVETSVKSTESKKKDGENWVLVDNLGTKVTEGTPVTNEPTPEFKKYSIRPLSDTFEKWWVRGRGPPYQCKLCGRDYGARYSVFYSHVRKHFIKKFPCTYCGKRFTSDKLIYHTRSHTNERPYLCEQCPARFISEAGLKRHKLSHTGEKPFICDVCGRGYSQNASLQTHMEIHYKTTGYVCEICGVTLTNYGCYRNHKIKHKMDTSTSEHNEQFPCNQCNAVFSKLHSLARHYRIHNNNVEVFKCTICDESFTESYSCEVHTFMHEVQSYETDLMSFHCKFCFDIFNNKKDLEEHLLMHLNNPYNCKNCNKSFPTKIRLRAHLRKYCDTRPFSCTDCGKAFRTFTALYQHKKIHTGKKTHICQVCTRAFLHPHQLMYHMLTHTGEKKYVCQYCGKAFALNGNLTVHVRRHTGETPYHCKICDKGFYDSSSRTKHIASKHRKENVKNEAADK